MRNRKLAIIMAVIMGLALLSGCSGDQQEDVQNEATEEVDSETTELCNLSEFTATTLYGEEFTRENFAQAELTVINVWATWCGPSIDEMPELAKFADTLPDRVQFITYCLDGTDDPATAIDIVEHAGFRGVTIIDGDGDLSTFNSQIMYTPTTVFVDSTGKQVGEAIIGADDDLIGTYTEYINYALKEIGKEEL